VRRASSKGALIVNPFDQVEMAEALDQACACR
jgi:trehalose-6-phosphate synthase